MQAPSLLPSSTLKLLGVTFDSHLSFKEHSASIIKSCNHLIWSIRHIRPLLSVDTTSALAHSLVLSRLDYCNSLLYGTSTSLIHSLQRVQNKLAKLVLLNPTLNSTDCLKKLHWLPIHDRIIFKIALMTYRTLAISNPPYLQHLLFRRHTSGLRSSSTIQLHQPVRKSSLINRGFSHASPAVWNALPPQSKRSTIPGALQKSPENPPLQDTNMKLMKTQGASDAGLLIFFYIRIFVFIVGDICT